MAKKQKFITYLSSHRKYIHLLFGIPLYLAIYRWHISLWWILGLGTITGIVFGKVFCRWMCPLGIMMEFIMKFLPANNSLQSMYQYHKIGCPVAWITGLLNKVSFYKIKFNAVTCNNCGLCDKACYMPVVEEKKFSFYKLGMINPANHFSCSKCLKCVADCPNGSLSVKSNLLVDILRLAQKV
jgi:polyferredoxin